MHEPYKRTRYVANKLNLRKVDGKLNVTCWCERQIVLVPVADVQRGRTLPCGHRTCHA